MKKRFRSGTEKEVSEILNAASIANDYEPYGIPYVWHQDRRYFPDFVLPEYFILEVKGRFLPADRKKHLFIKEQHPELDVRFVFCNSNSRLYKGAKSTYADWCMKNGFQYCDLKNAKKVLVEWLNEKGRSVTNLSGSVNARGARGEPKSRKNSISKRNSSGSSRRNKNRVQ